MTGEFKTEKLTGQLNLALVSKKYKKNIKKKVKTR